MRIAVLGAMLVLALAAAPARADQTVLPPTQFNVDGGSVTTPALVAGAQYRLESGGTFQDAGANITFDHDAAYCYDDDSTTPICKGDPSVSNTGLWAGYVGSDAAPFYELESSTPPAYAPSHRYYTRFVAAQSAPLRLLANTPEVGHGYPGQLAVALYKVSGSSGCSGRRRACTTTLASLDAKPRSGETIAYAGPPAEFTELARGPDLNKRIKSLSVDIDSASRNLDVYSVVPDDDTAESTLYLCFNFYFSSDFNLIIGRGAAFASCAAAVSAVLSRCKELKQQRGGPGICGGPSRRAASAGCSTKVIRPTKSSRKPKLKVRCTPTANGLHVTVKPKNKHKRLRKLLGKHPDLVIGASYADTTSSPVAVTWHLKR